MCEPTIVGLGLAVMSPDGLSLYLASTRTGTLGDNDIWAVDRASKDEPFGEPQNLGAPVNSTANDFWPTPPRGSYLMFVSERPGAGTCNAGPGLGDIYHPEECRFRMGRTAPSRLHRNRHRTQ